MPIVAIIRTLGIAIVSSFAVEKITDKIEPSEDLSELGAVAVYKRTWFDENMHILFLCGCFLFWVVFFWKKK